MSIDFSALAAPFPPEDIEWRLQSAGTKGDKVWAVCLAYVTNRAIQQRLDDVAGPANWRNEYTTGPDGGVLCGIFIRVGDEWVGKWDGAENTDVESVKGGLSGAMKRAAVQWGIGRYLYRLDEGFAKVHDQGKERGKTKEGTAFRWDPPQLPAWALPAKPRRPGDKTAEEHEAMLAWISEVGAGLSDEAELKIAGQTKPARAYIRGNWASIKEQFHLAKSVVSALEETTGSRFTPQL